METEDSPRGEMSFGEHLEELRRRLILGLVVPLPLAIVLFFFADTLRAILVKPALVALKANGLPAQLQALGPAEVLTTNLKLSIIGALAFSAPWLLWQLWKFVEPGLYMREQRFVRFLVPGSVILTLSGLALLYWVMLPLMLRVLISFGVPSPDNLVELTPEQAQIRITEKLNAGKAGIPVLKDTPENPAPGEIWVNADTRSLMIVLPTPGVDDAYELGTVAINRDGTIAQEFRLSEYITFVLLLILTITIAFQLPLVILLLGWVGLVPRTFLEKNRRYALLICAILAAVLTPADVVSMVMLLIPLYFLYELGILLLRVAPAHRIAEGTVLQGVTKDTFGGDDSRTSQSPYDQESDSRPTDPTQNDPGSTNSATEREDGTGKPDDPDRTDEDQR